ncbi:MAG: NEAT domain-containing protein, partial [Frisingicoccus sp.]
EAPEETPERLQQAVLDMLQAAVDGLVKKGDSSQGVVLEDGIYAIDFSVYQDKEKVNNGGTFEIGRTALVKAENGKYEVTFRKINTSNDTLYQVLRPEYYEEGYVGKGVGTKNWVDGFDYMNSELHPGLKSGFTEENNKYWLDTIYDIQENHTDFTVSLDSISDDILLYTADQNYIYQYYLDFNAETAEKINLTDYLNADSISCQIDSRKNAVNVANAENFFDADSVSWNVTGNTATMTLGINQEYYELIDTIVIYNEKWQGEQIPIENNAIKITFDLSDEKDIAVGKRLYMTGDNLSMSYVIRPSLRLSESFEIEEEITGTKIIANTDILPLDTQLMVSEIIDDPKNVEDAYTLFHSNLDSISKNMYMYYWNYKTSYEDGFINTSKPVTMKFKIPEGWNKNNIQLAYWGGPDTGGIDPASKYSVEIVGVEGDYYVVKTQRIGYFALYEVKDITATGDNFEDGTYTIPVSVYHLTIEGQASMADKCISDICKLVVKDGVKTLYMDYTIVENLNMESYMTKMWLYGSDMELGPTGSPKGTLNPVVFTSYYKNSDDSYFTDVFNEGTLNYYPKTGYVQLVSDAAQWPARFKVPIMDAIGGGNFEQDAWLTLDWANAEKISDKTPEAPIRDALAEAIQIAETAIKEEYTADSWAALETAHGSAVSVYNDTSSTTEAVNSAYTVLRTAIDGLTSPDALILNAGLYTATGTIADTEVVTGTRILVNEDKSAGIYLDVQGISDLMYYDITQKQYVAAELETMTDADGNTVVTGANFTLPAMSASVSVKYADIQGNEVQTTLSFTDFQAQTVDKTALTEALSIANEKLAEAAANANKYDADAVAELQKAVAAATKVSLDPVALQNEVEAQVTSLNTAISNLTLNVNLEALRDAVAMAETKDESQYTPKSWQILSGELDAARALLEKEGVTGQEIEAQTLRLNSAIEGLVSKADKTALQAAYDSAAALTNDGAYPGWDTLQTVLASAKAVLEDVDASQVEVDEQLNALNMAVENLSGSVDKSVLKDLITQAQDLDTSGYTESSVAFFEAALASAQTVMGDAGISQGDVDKQIQLLERSAEALIPKAQENTVYDGVYTIDGRIWHAAADQPSMGNAALQKPMQVIVKTDETTGETNVTLRMEFAPLTTSLGTTQFTGYLAVLNYFPDWEGGDTGYAMPSGETPVPANVEEYYADTYDVYNDPQTGTDANVKGKLYPHYMTMPVALGDNEIWVQVYVPVMEAINTGSGLQYAKLQLDWDSRAQISGIETDKTALKALIESASAIQQGEASDAVYAALQSAVAAAKDADANMNIDQTLVDNTVKALQAAVDAMTKEVVKADKSELKKAIDVADSYLNNANITYTETSRLLLQQARDEAQRVYEKENASQTEVNKCVQAVDRAIQSLVIVGADKSALATALSNTENFLNNGESYTAASLEALRAAYETAMEVYKDASASQEETDAQVRILNYLTGNLVEVRPVTVEKGGLHDLLMTAASMSGRESLYTEASISALKKAILEAESVYDNGEATQSEVNAQASKLTAAMLNLEQKPVDNSGNNNNNGNNGGSGNNGNNNNNGGNNSGNNSGNNNGSLDIKNLEDGVYALTGNMVKIDKVTASMSDAAINHTVELTVKDGKYYITLDFAGLTVGQQLGYLSQLKYFTTGYTLDQYGNPMGNLADVTVESYQKNSDGTLVSDSLGTNYPDVVTFELIPEALNDGYAPLQVFVPIMESIADGTGTQPVFLKLDWSTLTKTTADDPGFNGNDNNGSNNNNNNNNNNGSGNNNGGSNLSGGSSLGGGSSLSGGSSLNGGSSLSGGSSLNSGTSLKSGTSSLSGSSSLKSGGSTVKTGDEAPVNAWAALCAISALALIVAVMQRRKTKKHVK